MIFETERLILREMNQFDYPSLSAIIQDEQTMFAYNGAMSDEETQNWLDRQLKRYSNDGFGLWAVILKENGKMIGQAGISWQEIENGRVPEIGYLFNREYWKNGYAIEAAKACKQYAFDILGFNEIYSIVRDINIPSMNVAIRNVMLIRNQTIRYYRGVNMIHYLFSVRRDSQ